MLSNVNVDFPGASPGVTPRPSLNGHLVRPGGHRLRGVAGGNPPALIERPSSAPAAPPKRTSVAGGNPPALIERPTSPSTTPASAPASPGVTPRPSLNDEESTGPAVVQQASPGVTPRPSLNAQEIVGIAGRHQASPGVTPRPSLNDGRGERPPICSSGVAGGNPSALIERPSRRASTAARSRVAGGKPPGPH